MNVSDSSLYSQTAVHSFGSVPAASGPLKPQTNPVWYAVGAWGGFSVLVALILWWNKDAVDSSSCMKCFHRQGQMALCGNGWFGVAGTWSNIAAIICLLITLWIRYV